MQWPAFKIFCNFSTNKISRGIGEKGLTFNSTLLPPNRWFYSRSKERPRESRPCPSLKSSPGYDRKFLRQLWTGKHAKILLVSQKSHFSRELDAHPDDLPTTKLIPLPGCMVRALPSFLFVFPSSFSTSISLSANVLRRSRLWLEWRLFRISFRWPAVISNNSFCMLGSRRVNAIRVSGWKGTASQEAPTYKTKERVAGTVSVICFSLTAHNHTILKQKYFVIS